ncbi:MAG: acyl-CoA dehydratase activase [Anaerovoracaceae bacterium]|jgi:predicted CoA-substrate-specific enzyme activase
MADFKYTLGIDVGSTSSKCVVMEDGIKIAAKSLIAFGAGTSGPDRSIEMVLEKANLNIPEMCGILATGYGRKSVEIANWEMSELSCHAKGANYLFPQARTVIDIGGQDAKVLRIGGNGMMENFVMNDKCAAGTGRFLDVMARILELDVSELEGLGNQSKEFLTISSTCTVFAESEVISQLSAGRDRRDVIAGIHRSVASRVAGLVRRMGVVPQVVMTGGVSQNGGVLKALEDELEIEIKTSPLAPYAGALGAALFAYDKAKRGRS